MGDNQIPNFSSYNFLMSRKICLNVIIATSGTRGDVQPYIALALLLKLRGHNVSIATEERMRNLVEEFGLAYRCIGGDPTGLIFDFDPKVQEVLRRGHILKLISLTQEWDKKFNKAEILDSYEAACMDADVIISAGLTLTQTFCVAEKLNCVWIPVILGPTLPTQEFPLWALEGLMCGCSCLNKWTYNVAFSAMWDNEKSFINPWRVDRLGLEPITERRGIADILDRIKPPILIACSEAISGPHGRIPGDYPPNAHLLGFLFVPPTSEEQIDPRLTNFIENDVRASMTPFDEEMRSDLSLNTISRPVIYLGFGSMPSENPITLLQLAVNVCERVGCRAIVIAGWAQLDDPDCVRIISEAQAKGTILVLKAAPHDWLFPRVACIVHHCGVRNEYALSFIIYSS